MAIHGWRQYFAEFNITETDFISTTKNSISFNDALKHRDDKNHSLAIAHRPCTQIYENHVSVSCLIKQARKTLPTILETHDPLLYL